MMFGMKVVEMSCSIRKKLVSERHQPRNNNFLVVSDNSLDSDDFNGECWCQLTWKQYQECTNISFALLRQNFFGAKIWNFSINRDFFASICKFWICSRVHCFFFNFAAFFKEKNQLFRKNWLEIFCFLSFVSKFFLDHFDFVFVFVFVFRVRLIFPEQHLRYRWTRFGAKWKLGQARFWQFRKVLAILVRVG